MTEFELKLETPPDRADALAAALREAGAQELRLQAHYVDTPDGALARHGIGLRLRREGGDWVQTAKAGGRGPLERLEHNAPVRGVEGDAPPALDLTRHAGTAVGERIAAALGSSVLPAGAAGLVPVFSSDVRRLACTLQHGGSRVELAFDRGELHAGTATQPLCEIEFELKEGEPADAVALARQWCARHGLWLSIVSKAAKGCRLAAGQAAGPVAHGEAPVFPLSRADGPAVARAVLQACLAPVLANGSDVAAGHGGEDHVHQLRVGLRRTRTALRELKVLGVRADPAWAEAIAATFRVLGAHRDHGQLVAHLLPMLREAGGPALDFPPPQDVPDAASAVRAPAFQDALLALLGVAHGDPASTAPDTPGAHQARKRLRKRLHKLHARLLDDGERFADLPEDEQHAARKRAKRLRYLAELVGPLVQRRKPKEFLAGLKVVQEALGRYNDEVVALEASRALLPAQPGAWFAVGWLRARKSANAQDCVHALEAFAKVKPFWD